MVLRQLNDDFLVSGPRTVGALQSTLKEILFRQQGLKSFVQVSEMFGEPESLIQ